MCQLKPISQASHLRRVGSGETDIVRIGNLWGERIGNLWVASLLGVYLSPVSKRHVGRPP